MYLRPNKRTHAVVLQEWLLTEDNKVKHGEMCLSLSDTHQGSVLRLQRCAPHDTQQVCASTAVSRSH